ncbi:MAG: NUDIX hydrolase [Calditrichaceae bacterium]
MNYCSNCGEKVVLVIPDGDNIPRFVCESCGTIHYKNPRMIVGCIPVLDDQIMLCKRSIEPCMGLWTIPAGFMENDETVEEGAIRETIEETNSQIEIERLHTVYSIPQIDQVYLLFLAKITNFIRKPGLECSDVRLFRAAEIPWDHIAFSAVKYALEKYIEDTDPNSNTNGNLMVHLGTHTD